MSFAAGRLRRAPARGNPIDNSDGDDANDDGPNFDAAGLNSNSDAGLGSLGSEPSLWMSQIVETLVETSVETIVVDDTDSFMDFCLEGASLREAAEQRRKEEWKRKEAMEEAMKLRVTGLVKEAEEKRKEKEEERKRDFAEMSDSQIMRKCGD